jgi:Tfp pilus assembly protein PilO
VENKEQTIALLLILMCLGLGAYFMVPKAQTTYTVYKEVQDKIQANDLLQKEIEDLKQKKEQRVITEQSSAKPVYQSDAEVTDQMSSYGVMFEDVIQAAKYNGLKLRSISYDTAPADDEINKNLAALYNACAIKMQLIGNYSQFRSYFQDIYNYPYLINLDKVSIKPYEKNKKILIADVVVSIYSAKNEAQKAAYAQAQQLQAEADQAVAGSGIK